MICQYLCKRIIITTRYPITVKYQDCIATRRSGRSRRDLISNGEPGCLRAGWVSTAKWRCCRCWCDRRRIRWVLTCRRLKTNNGNGVTSRHQSKVRGHGERVSRVNSERGREKRRCDIRLSPSRQRGLHVPGQGSDGEQCQYETNT